MEKWSRRPAPIWSGPVQGRRRHGQRHSVGLDAGRLPWARQSLGLYPQRHDRAAASPTASSARNLSLDVITLGNSALPATTRARSSGYWRGRNARDRSSSGSTLRLCASCASPRSSTGHLIHAGSSRCSTRPRNSAASSLRDRVRAAPRRAGGGFGTAVTPSPSLLAGIAGRGI